MTALDLSPVFPNTGADTKSYVTRYRPGSQTLIATDSEGRPLRATLEILFGTSSGDPYVQSEMSNSNWQLVTGGWRLLPDRLGVEVTVEDPEQWNGGKSVGDIRGVTWQAAPPSGKQFILRLTTVIDDDLRLPISAPKRIASPTQFTRWGSADARDHFQYASVSPGSRNYQAMNGDGTDPVVVRDDTSNAMAHAYQFRSAQRVPPPDRIARDPLHHDLLSGRRSHPRDRRAERLPPDERGYRPRRGPELSLGRRFVLDIRAGWPIYPTSALGLSGGGI